MLQGAQGMTAVDFTAFLDELASVSGETILPFFRVGDGADISLEDAHITEQE